MLLGVKLLQAYATLTYGLVRLPRKLPYVLLCSFFSPSGVILQKKKKTLSISAKIKKSDWTSVTKNTNWDIKTLLVGKSLVKLTE